MPYSMNATTKTPQIKLTEENAEMLQKLRTESLRSLTQEANLILRNFAGNSRQRRTQKRATERRGK